MRGIKITPLFHGNMHADKEVLITGHPESFLTRGNHQPTNRVWCEVPSFTYLIEHPDGRLLFDATISKHWEDEWLPEYKELAPYDDYTDEQLLENSLKKHGLGPEDIDYVFLSHLHVDHAGNARLFATTDTQLLLHDKEFTAAANREEDGDFFLKVDYDVPGGRFVTLPGDTEIIKDVHALSVPGHTEGTMALMLHLEHSGTIILTSDACYLKESYESEVGSAISANLEEWKRSLRKLKMMSRAYGATVIPGHDHNVCHDHHSPIAGEDKLRVDGEYD